MKRSSPQTMGPRTYLISDDDTASVQSLSCQLPGGAEAPRADELSPALQGTKHVRTA